MKEYEVIATQVCHNLARVIHEEFDNHDAARQYADEICDDRRTVSCSIYKNQCLVMDVL